jgi:hypothetical protein
MTHIRNRRPPLRTLMGVRVRLRPSREQEFRSRAVMSGRSVEQEWALTMRSYLGA